MSDHDDLSLINGAFAELRDETLPYVKPAGTARAHATVRHQRKVRAITAGVFTVIALVLPVAAVASLNSSNAPPAASATTGPAPVESPSAGPSASPSPSPSPSPGRSAMTDGQISLAELGKATLDLPATAAYCARGRVTFAGGQVTTEDPLFPGLVTKIVKTAYADVNHDGTQDTIALFRCVTQGGNWEAAAFTRDTTGTIRTLGLIAANRLLDAGGNPAPVAPNDPKILFDIAGTATGNVSVQVGDFAPCCATRDHRTEPQWRTFGYDGQKFSQVGGPTAFPANPKFVDLAVTGTDLVLGKPANGKRTGTVTVTVKNLGNLTAPSLQFSVTAPQSLGAIGEWDGCTKLVNAAGPEWRCVDTDELAPGAERVMTLEFTAPDQDPDPGQQVQLQASVVLPSEGMLAESDSRNNHLTAAIKRP